MKVQMCLSVLWKTPGYPVVDVALASAWNPEKPSQNPRQT